MAQNNCEYCGSDKGFSHFGIVLYCNNCGRGIGEDGETNYVLAEVKVKIFVPEDFEGVGPWDKEPALYDFIRHWLCEGYYIGPFDVPDFPCGLQFGGFDVDFPEDWAETQD